MLLSQSRPPASSMFSVSPGSHGLQLRPDLSVPLPETHRCPSLSAPYQYSLSVEEEFSLPRRRTGTHSCLARRRGVNVKNVDTEVPREILGPSTLDTSVPLESSTRPDERPMQAPASVCDSPGSRIAEYARLRRLQQYQERSRPQAPEPRQWTDGYGFPYSPLHCNSDAFGDRGSFWRM